MARSKPVIEFKSPAEIEKMRAAGRIVRKVLDHAASLCTPGRTTGEIDAEAGALIRRLGGEGLFKGYPGPTPFPSHLCISVNEVVVHGIAGDRALKAGDLVGLDCGVRLDGWCGDAAVSVPVGELAPEVKRLNDTTRETLELAVRSIKPGRKWSEVARALQVFVEGRGFGVVRTFSGHGIGRQLHMAPQIPNYVDRDLLKNDWTLCEGMTLAVEPMVNAGTWKTEILADGWTVVTADRRPSAHWEHTIAVTRDGADVLTDGR